MENENVHRISQEGREIVLVGTAHVSRESADLVEQVIAEEKPDTVCVELCKPRYEAIRQQDQWQQTDIVKVIREKRTTILLSQLMMASLQRKIAQKFNITPGEEMLRAIAKAEEAGAEIVLADREIRVTLLRTWRKMGFWNKAKFLTEILFSLFSTEEITEEEIEKLKKQDVLELALQTVGEKLPSIKTTLIDERDLYLAHSIGQASGARIVAVVGAGHVPGILKHLGEEIDIEALNKIPEQGVWGRYAGWGFSLLIVGLFVAGFFFSGSQASLKMITWWASITAAFSGLGALLLLAHPLTIAASALAAPVTTLHPLIAAGWVAGLVEASLRKPQVKDFLALKDDITSLRGFFRNKITRLLLLVAVVNLTTSIGTFVAIPVIMRFL
ncbi:MAG: TraB/GumN family protein [Deltaproteobacteria bacterium]|nr:TraB/GumN family protein [Deltaproteobacteria bacterium]